VLFLGTPHRGSHFGWWGHLFAIFLQPLGSNPTLFVPLDYDSTQLRDLDEDFMDITGDSLSVVNFFEERKIRVFQMGFIRWDKYVSNSRLEKTAI
jgi:hypothetical protein